MAEFGIRHGALLAIEWPSSCTYWFDQRIQAFISKYKLQKTKLIGCAVGLTSTAAKSAGLPILKPWTIMSNMCEIHDHMSLTCPGCPVHAKCEGKDTVLSGRYTRIFVRKVHDAFRMHVDEGNETVTSSRDTRASAVDAAPCTVLDSFPNPKFGSTAFSGGRSRGIALRTSKYTLLLAEYLRT